MADKLRKVFSYTGVRDEVFPGIRLAFLPVWALTLEFKQQLLGFLGLPEASRTLSHTVVVVTTVVGSVALWAWAGYLLDPLYDFLYGPKGLWTSSPGRKWLFFTSAYDLDRFRTRAREALAKEDPVYRDPDMAIYGQTLKKLAIADAALHGAVQAQLENSKAFRSAVLPVLGLMIYFFWYHSWGAALVATVALIAVLELSFRFRASHALEAYRWLVGR